MNENRNNDSSGNVSHNSFGEKSGRSLPDGQGKKILRQRSKNAPHNQKCLLFIQSARRTFTAEKVQLAAFWTDLSVSPPEGAGQ